MQRYDTCPQSLPLHSHPVQIVRQIREAGGIPFIKTNVPQTMLAFECQNPVFGRTLNPYSDAHTCGGSSGGEAAVLACDGAALGIGSDVGGRYVSLMCEKGMADMRNSLRIPISYCGIYALKPGQFRMSTTGIRSCVPGFEVSIARLILQRTALRTSSRRYGRSSDLWDDLWKTSSWRVKSSLVIRECPWKASPLSLTASRRSPKD